MIRKIAKLLFVIPFVFFCTTVLAQDVEKKVLTVSGGTAAGKSAQLSIHDLEKLPQVEYETATPWHDGKVSFKGVLLSDLMDHLGAKGDTAEVVALNDYRAVLPVSDFDEHAPILAYQLNGKYMRIRDKGPLFVIYPFDDKPELKTEVHYSRSVWQVRSIVVE
ncbi:molybdopterin-dependent oxidoreductase [Roseibium sp. SCPC15]|uniref:molybdopterin-dependent oxidoreductase n=1 Tax=Roseibium sp. SCP15 TaxID=3141376 RepID=UPI00333ABEF7